MNLEVLWTSVPVALTLLLLIIATPIFFPLVVLFLPLLFIYLFKTKLSIMYSMVTYLLIILYLLAPGWGLWPCNAPS